MTAKNQTPIELRLVLQAYVACALWSSTDNDGSPMDDQYDETDLSAETLHAMETSCEGFLEMAKDYLTDDWFDSQVGHDFWLTRNGHGAGFWDRGLPNGDKLTEIAKTFGSSDLYVGDDGKIHAF